MALNSDWDVEQYRHHWESDDQWEVRRQFMDAHKDEIPEGKLVCLAQVYANIEFLQCSYPAKVMEQVKALSAGLDESMLEKRREKQKVSFVKGSEDNKCKTQVKGEKRPPPAKYDPSKRSRWEMPADSNRPQNRATASSYFESNASNNPSDAPSPKTEPQTQYSTQQSYYTSTYYNRTQNPHANNSGSNRGPGADCNADISFDSSNLGNNNAMSNQNLVSRTTTVSGKTPANDGIISDQEKRFQYLVELVSDPGYAGNVGIPFFHNMADKAKLRIRYDWKETKGKKTKKGRKSFFQCLVYIDNVLVFTSDQVKKKHLSKLLAVEFAIKKLRNSRVKIIKNDGGQLELITSGPSVAHDDPVAVPGPSDTLSSDDPLTMARTHFSNFIIIEYAYLPTTANAISILNNSAQLNGRKIMFTHVSCPTSTQPNLWRCLVKISNIAVGESTGVKRGDVRREAAATALELLRSVAYTLVVKQAAMPGRHVSKEEFAFMEDNGSANPEDVAISQDNVGNKLLRLMGWSGSGGLGKQGKGIAEPIKATDVRGREGFGLPTSGGTSKQFLDKARAVIGEYASTPVQWDLVFSNEFSKDERAALHKIAMKRRLKSGSKGSGAARYLVISHPVDRMKILQQLIREGGSNEKYTVIPPSGKPFDAMQNAELCSSVNSCPE